MGCADLGGTDVLGWRALSAVSAVAEGEGGDGVYEGGRGMRVRGRSEVDGVGCVGNGLV